MDTSGGSDGRRMGRASRGQSSVLGFILVLGLVLSGTAVVVMLGTGALGDVQTQTELERAEHSMTLFNSRAAMAALGDSPTQQVSFGSDQGTFETREGKSRLVITHANYTGNGVDEEVYNRTLGTVVYENDGTEIAYEGGGVWRKDPGGQGMMISPPEFHYRAATLTLPIVRVQDAGSDGGSTVQISKAEETKRVFPNVSQTYSNGNAFQNPVANGTVNITVESPYYNGWAEYFRSNTDGNVTAFPDQNRVRVTLVSLAGSVGNFQIPSEGEDLKIGGMGEDHPLNEFNISLYPDNKYQNMHWSLYSGEASQEFELHFELDDPCTGTGGELDVSVYYANTSAAGSVQEEWQTVVDTSISDDFEVNCSTGELSMNLTGTTELDYGEIDTTGSSNKWHFSSGIDDPVDDPTKTFGEHSEDSIAEYDAGSDSEELGFLLSHYMGVLGPQFDLTVTDGPGGSSRVDEGASNGTLRFDSSAGSQYITFLHVTENEIEVTFD